MISARSDSQSTILPLPRRPIGPDHYHLRQCLIPPLAATALPIALQKPRGTPSLFRRRVHGLATGQGAPSFGHCGLRNKTREGSQLWVDFRFTVWAFAFTFVVAPNNPTNWNYGALALDTWAEGSKPLIVFFGCCCWSDISNLFSRHLAIHADVRMLLVASPRPAGPRLVLLCISRLLNLEQSLANVWLGILRPVGRPCIGA